MWQIIRHTLTKEQPIALAFCVSALLCATQFIPSQMGHFVGGLDDTWQYILHKGFAEHWQWGKEIVWHYGPLGFLQNRMYYPETYGMLVLGWAVLLSVILGSVSYITLQQKEKNPFAIVLVAIVCLLGSDVTFFMPVLVLFMLFFMMGKRPSEEALFRLIALIAVLGMTKISALFAGLVLVICMDIAVYRKQVRLPFYSLFWLAVGLITWKAAGQEWQHLLPFIKGAIENTQGFSEFVSTSVPWVALLFFVLGAGFVARMVLPAIKDPMGKLFLLFIGIYSLKLGFLNANDHHVLQALMIWLVLLVVAKDWFWKHIPEIEKRLFAVYVGVLIVAAVGKAFFSPNSEIHDVALQMQEYDPAQHNITLSADIPAVEGRVDLYDAMQMQLLKEGYDYSPRPVFQSYHAVTPYLSALNAAHLHSAVAAEHIFFRFLPLMGRYPTMSDAASLPLLFSYYDIAALATPYLRLEKREIPHNIKKTKLVSFKTMLNAAGVEIPKNIHPLWVKMEVRPTWIGRLASLLFRKPHLYLEVTTRSQYTARLRVSADMLGAGFMLSPLLEGALDMALLVGDPAQLYPKQVAKLSLKTETPSWLGTLFYGNHITADIETLVLPKISLEKVEGWERVKTTAGMMAYPLPFKAQALRGVDGQHLQLSYVNDAPAVKVNGNTKMALSLEGTPKMLVGSVGVFARDIQDPAEGLAFVVYGRRAGETQFSILTHISMPHTEGGKRYTMEAFNVMLEPDIDMLIFETVAKDPMLPTRGFWRDVQLFE
jgi:hypothetical protein